MIVVDRVEGDRAVLEVNGEIVVFPASALPAGAVEGSVLELSRGDASDLLAAAQARIDRLAARGPVGDVIDLSGPDVTEL